MTPHKIIASLGLAGALLLGGGAACAPGDEQSTQSTGAASAPADTAQPTQPTQPTEPTDTGDAGDAVETIRVSVQDGEASPPPERVTVQRGQRVRIVVTSDQPDEVHVHGYDQSVELEPGEPASVEFTADQPGLYEVETHESGTLLFQLAVEG